MKQAIFCFFLLLSVNLYSQDVQNVIKDLKSDLKAKPDLQKKAAIYSDLTWYYTDISIDSSIFYGKKALESARILKDEKLLSQVYSDLGAAYFRNGDFKKSKSNYLKGYSIRKKNKDFEGVAKININLASVLTSNQNYKEAVKSYLEAINYFEGRNDTIANITKSNLAIVFHEMKNNNKALLYQKEALYFLEKNNLQYNLADAYLTLGSIYSDLNDNKKAEFYFNKSLKAGFLIKDNLAIVNAYENLASIKLDENKPKEAIIIYEKSEKYLNSLNTDIDIAVYEINISRAYLQMKDYKKAKNILNKNISFFKNQNNKTYLLDIYKRLTESYLYLNSPDSAASYLKSYNELKDVLSKEQINKQTTETETKYQTAKKEKLLLQKEAEAKKKNIILIIVSLLTLFIAMIGFLIYRQQKLKQKQQEQEFELKTAISQIENQNKLQEQRLNISRDLHDNIGSQLTFIISSVDNVKYAFDIDNKKLDDKLTNISSFAKETIVELRDTIWAMNSNEISFEDLESRIHNFIEKAKEAKDEIQFFFQIDSELKDTKLTSVEGMNLYRTIQEAVNNAIKYANASSISIAVKRIENQIQIAIEDNGIGFDETTIQKGNGLKNMQKRIEDIGGKFHLFSSHEGTKIVVSI
ncbi:tetratricopeptide repeat-containing sensor histidine kinase [Flavobacterium hydrophilum]|uniref:histidine kinase n=1 Tax=Flavobacterium hydrophilum TaxID=2211445 RepID=A0A2V4C734_9FLAO|nr:sensor histidine kinase [Flavobacterium hydrophilum]PXY47129.1 hypothetical protein DMB68_08275 [Flavobacterium hydrophilum]